MSRDSSRNDRKKRKHVSRWSIVENATAAGLSHDSQDSHVNDTSGGVGCSVIPVARVTLVLLTLKMVRGLSQWTKTLSFPARVSPQRTAKETKAFHVSPSASPTSPPSPINDTMDKAPIITDEVRHPFFFFNFLF